MDIHMAKYLVTGGAGFIGSHLVDALVAEQHQVFVLDDLSNGNKKNLPKNITFYHDDISNESLVNQLIPEMDACFHLAAIPSIEKYNKDWLGTHRVNLSGTINILNAARKRKTPIIYASSCAVYGDNPHLPLKESVLSQPLSSYGADKLACEHQATIASQLFGVPTLGLRFFNVYGARQDPKSPYSGVISIYIEHAIQNQSLPFFGDGKQTRDFIHIHDVVTACLAALKHCDTRANIFNVCTGKQQTLLELSEIIANVLEKKINCDFQPERAGDVKYSCGDPEKAFRELGFKSEISLAQGLRLSL